MKRDSLARRAAGAAMIFVLALSPGGVDGALARVVSGRTAAPAGASLTPVLPVSSSLSPVDVSLSAAAPAAFFSGLPSVGPALRPEAALYASIQSPPVSASGVREAGVVAIAPVRSVPLRAARASRFASRSRGRTLGSAAALAKGAAEVPSSGGSLLGSFFDRSAKGILSGSAPAAPAGVRAASLLSRGAGFKPGKALRGSPAAVAPAKAASPRKARRPLLGLSNAGIAALTLTGAGLLTIGAIESLGLLGAFILQVAVFAGCVYVYRSSDVFSTTERWAGWTAGVTGLMFAVLAGPVAQAMAPAGPVPAPLSYVLGGAPAAMMGLTLMRVLQLRLRPLSRKSRKAVLAAAPAGAVSEELLRSLTGLRPKRLKALQALRELDPAADPDALEPYFPVLAELAKRDPDPDARRKALGAIANGGKSPALRREVRDTLGRLRADPGDLLDKRDIADYVKWVDALEAKENEEMTAENPDLAELARGQDEDEALELLKRAEDRLAGGRGRTLIEVLRTRVIRQAAERLRKAVEAGDPDALKIAAGRLERLLGDRLPAA